MRNMGRENSVSERKPGPTLAHLVNELSADVCRHHLAGELAAVEWTVVRDGTGLGSRKRPPLFRIKNRNVCKAPACQRAPAIQIEDPRRTRGEQFHDTYQGNFVFSV